jgi:hypothetical protein
MATAIRPRNRVGTEGWSRQDSIDRLRDALTPMTDGDRSLCQVAAERGIFCRGFRRWHVAEFDRRWRHAIGRSTHLAREEMERFADIWQLTEQLRQGTALPCNAKSELDSPCRGWDEFSDQELARFCRELVENADQKKVGPANLDIPSPGVQALVI